MFFFHFYLHCINNFLTYTLYNCEYRLQDEKSGNENVGKRTSATPEHNRSFICFEERINTLQAYNRLCYTEITPFTPKI